MNIPIQIKEQGVGIKHRHIIDVKRHLRRFCQNKKNKNIIDNLTIKLENNY